MKTLKNILVLGLITFGLLAFKTAIQEEWVVPAKYKTMENPTDPADDEGLEIGEELYMQHCKSCHGKEGLGDGSKADEQKGELGDFSSEEFQAQSDGDLFYKSKIGRDDMPDFSKKIPDDEEIWFVVNFMRTLGE
ncbi:MAG: cytochrome c [Bacteroidetes bacterium]|nr:MAG: cytochrome c [Bacteroidota bacterium]